MNLNKYEVVFILNPDMEKEALYATCDKIKGLITKAGGKIVDTIFWGVRKLAYDIKKNDKGFYVLVLFDGPSPLIKEVSENMRIMPEVLRFMFSKGYKVRKAAPQDENPVAATESAPVSQNETPAADETPVAEDVNTAENEA